MNANLRKKSGRNINSHKEHYSKKPVIILKEGIPLDRIILPNENKEILNELKCPICYNLVWEAVECKGCGILFCKYCIEKSKNSTNDNCPFCRKSPFEPSPSEFKDVVLGTIRIKCSNKNCHEKPDYFHYLEHLNKCKFGLYKCNNVGCNFEGTLDKIKDHPNQCEYRLIQCENCEKEIKYIEYDNHIQKECTRNIKCSLCHAQMTIGYYNSTHTKDKNQIIACLKAQVKYYQEKIKNGETTNKEEINKLKNSHEFEISKLKEEYNSLELQNKEFASKIKNLENELSEWKNNFKEIYDRFFNENEPNENKSRNTGFRTKTSRDESNKNYNKKSYQNKCDFKRFSQEKKNIAYKKNRIESNVPDFNQLENLYPYKINNFMNKNLLTEKKDDNK